MINYVVELGKSANDKPAAEKTTKAKRIKVNDKTASGGWF